MLSNFHLRLEPFFYLIILICLTTACSQSEEVNSAQMIETNEKIGMVYAQLVDRKDATNLLIFNESPEAITVDSTFGDQSMRSDSKLDTVIVASKMDRVNELNKSTMPPLVLRRSYPLIVLGPGRVIGMTMRKDEILDAIGANACGEVGFETNYQVKNAIKKVRSNLLTICRN